MVLMQKRQQYKIILPLNLVCCQKSIVEGTAIADDVFCSPTVVQDGVGLFEMHILSLLPPTVSSHPAVGIDGFRESSQGQSYSLI